MSHPGKEKTRDRNGILEMIYAFYEKKNNIFFSTMEQFDSFYSESDYSLKIGAHHYRPSGDFALMIIANQVTDETDYVCFKYRYEHFDREGIEPFDYESSLTFKLDHKKWSFETSDKKLSIERSYAEELSEEEIKKFVDHEAKKHKALIGGKN